MAKGEDERDDRKRKYNSMTSTEVREGSIEEEEGIRDLRQLGGIRLDTLTRLLACSSARLDGGYFRARVPVRLKVS